MRPRWHGRAVRGALEVRPAGGPPGAARPAPGAALLLREGLLRLVPLVTAVALAGPPGWASPAECEAAPASPVTVEAAVGQSEVTVGETFTLEVKASGPPGTTYAFPAGVSEESLELSTPAPSAEADAGPPPPPGTHRYEAAVFALGEVTLPPIPVRYRLPDGTEGQVETGTVAVEVVSMLPKDPDAQKLADIRAPRTATIGRAFWIALGVCLALLAALAAWIVRRRRPGREAVAPVLPDVPPDVEALRALGDLAAARLLEGGAFRTFYIRLTAVAKRYLERRLGAPVLEMTTAETLALLRGHAHGAAVLPVMRDLAGAADRIKFARGQGLEPEAVRHLETVRELVVALEARLRPAAPDSAEPGRAA